MQKLLQRAGILLMLGLLFLTIALRLAEPVRDGDLFWQMEYGRYMLENNTLIPDHGRYSWTPADPVAIYCAWLSEMAFYLLYKIGGLPALFVMKYLCFFLVFAIFWYYAWRMKWRWDAGMCLVTLMILQGSYAAAFLKPEIFSMVYFAVFSAIYFFVKSNLSPRWTPKSFLLFPFLFLIWANTHGVFLNALALMACIVFGETVNYLRGNRYSLSKKGLCYLYTSAVFSLLSTFITPYGISYYLKIYELSFSSKNMLAMGSVLAYTPLFQSKNIFLCTIFLVMAAMIVTLLGRGIWKNKSIDWAILISNLFLGAFYVTFLRATYYWPVFGAMSIVYLYSQYRPDWPSITGVSLTIKAGKYLLLLLSTIYTLYVIMVSPERNSWLGFGVGYYNPVQASAFLKEHQPGKRLFNSYNTGGYLIHDLYPTYKVFCDQRAFPYLDWYQEYLEFNYGPTTVDDFTQKYPFDVAIVDYFAASSPMLKFLKSKDWKPVFYGPAAMVFVKKDANINLDHRKADKHRFDDIKNLEQLKLVFFLSQNLEDLNTSKHILELIKTKFIYHPQHKYSVKQCTTYQNGLLAFKMGDYEKALKLLDLLGEKQFTPSVNTKLFQLRNWKAKQLVQKGHISSALKMIEKNLSNNPTYLEGLYNAGILSYYLEALSNNSRKKENFNARTLPQFNTEIGSKKWREYLERFLHLAPHHRFAEIAKGLLQGKILEGNVQLAL